MALFGSNKKKTTTAAAPSARKAAAPAVRTEKRAMLEHVLRRPHVTEKAAVVAERGVYVFEVDPRATKRDVAEAVENVYKVTPVRVNMVRKHMRRTASRMRRFMVRKPGLKKAYVYLKEGDRIEFV